MLIDWFTVTAQIINFMILLVLLKIFLFDKIKTAMDQREKNIQERFDKAEQQEKEAQQALENYRASSKALEETMAAKLEEAEKEAKERRKTLVKEARQEVDALKANWQSSLDRQKTSFFERFQKQAARLIFNTVKKTLSLLADTDAQGQAVKHFLTRFQDLDKDQLPDTLESPPRVSSGFELSEEQKKSIQQAVSQKLSSVKQPDVKQPDMDHPDVQQPYGQQIKFNVRPELIFGIVLFAGDKKITWHAQDYLKSLEKKLNQAIEGKENE
ncbi:MAG: hypothetical protein RBR67_05970 [Desulfobacterium sp.]|jgi:F-type H+-transporting ATPase subunit b|nr:hypothetical protein [Desulfobacterium sp.]